MSQANRVDTRSGPSLIAAVGTMYIIDAHALNFQMFHAIQELNAPVGRPMNAVFGVTRALLWIHQEVRPE